MRTDRRVLGVAGLLLIGVGCDNMIYQGGGHVTTDGPSRTCTNAVQISASADYVLPYGLVQFTASGGDAAYTFSADGGEIDPSRGAWIAPGEAGEVTITAEASSCVSSASVTVTVVTPMTVRPTHTTLLPGATVVLDLTDGSGEYDCALHADTSGGALTDCTFTAGGTEGLDVVRVTDVHTGQFVDSRFTVDADARLLVAGHGRIFVPHGGSFVPDVLGGSGYATASVGSGDLVVSGGVVSGGDPGRSTLVLTDDYTGATSEVSVEVVAPQFLDIPPDGERTGQGIALPLGDLNGDGYADAALGFIEMSLGAYYSGGVLVFAGGPGGLDPTPVQVIAGDGIEATWGRSLTVGDVDGDGLPDLLVGADRTDRNGTNTGSLRIYPGVQGGFFADSPSATLVGELIYGRLGTSVVLCDFDADGFDDLAVGALDHSDQSVAVPAHEQGSIYIWRGSAAGFSARSDFKLHGQLPDGNGGWEDVEGMKLGDAMAAGDLDGDGLCDLAVAASDFSFDRSGSDGLVAVYQGTTDQGLLLTRTPVRIYAADDNAGGELGRRIAIGDLDGDHKAELVLGHWRSDVNGDYTGQVHLFRGGPLTGDADVPVPPSAADWTLTGEAGDYLGADVQLAHMNSDTTLDLVVGAWRAQTEGGAYSEGVVYVFEGDVTDGQATTADADRAVPGRSSYDRFGQAAAGIGDASGDDVPDLLVLSGYDDALGVEHGAAYFVDGATGALTLLEMPSVSSGHEFGRGIALFDADGDGTKELLVGAPGAGDPAEGAASGMVTLHEPTATGYEAEGVQIFGGHANHSSNDYFGYRVEPAGDFDGDGYQDLVVLARKDSKPTSFGSSYANPSECPGYISLAGAAYVYRGGPSGLADEPSFVVYGSSTSDYVFEVAGGFDHDGDGRDDLVIGSKEWHGDGGFAIAYGRAAPADDILVICDASRYEGFNVFDRLGVAVTGLGDVDGDGCDELAVGASGEEFHSDWFNQGSVRVLWGHGGPGCPADPQVTALAIKVPGTEAGGSLAGGLDVDGDDIPDLVVGADAYRQDFSENGAAWLVPGSHLLTLSREDLPASALPARTTWQWQFMLPDDGLEGRFGLVGTASGGLFGRATALVPDGAGGAMVAVGAPLGDDGGNALGGGVRVHRYVAGALEDQPYGLLVGEAFAGALGDPLRGALVDGTPVLIVGAPDSSANGLETGAVYVLRFDDL